VSAQIIPLMPWKRHNQLKQRTVTFASHYEKEAPKSGNNIMEPLRACGKTTANLDLLFAISAYYVPYTLRSSASGKEATTLSHGCSTTSISFLAIKSM